MERRPCWEASTRQGHRTAEKPALPAADLGIAASGAVVYAAPGRGALPFSRTPKPQLFISIQVIRRLLPLVTPLKTSFPLESPPLCCPRSPTGQNLCPPTCVVTCHFFMLSPHPGRCLTPPQDAWERLTGMHSGINMCHSLTELGPTESASQAQFRSQIKATSYWITWFM